MSNETKTQPKAQTVITLALQLSKEDQVAMMHEVAKAAGLKVVQAGQTGSKKWPTAQAFYVHMLAHTEGVISKVKAKKITWEEGARALMGTKEFQENVVDFSDKGKERLKGELSRMVRKFAKDTNVDLEKVAKVWDTPAPVVAPITPPAPPAPPAPKA